MIFCPFGRLRYGIDPGVGAQRPYDAVVHSECRCSEANRSRCARIGPVTKVPRAPASGPYAGAKPFGLPFWRLKKVTRCKSETASRSTEKTDIHPKPQEPGRPRGRQGRQKTKPPTNLKSVGGFLLSRDPRRLATPDLSSPYWQASQSGSSIAQAFGTGAGPAGAARTESSPWLPPLETAFSLPVLMVDFSVLVAARARR